VQAVVAESQEHQEQTVPQEQTEKMLFGALKVNG
jgi:hypothetical protein